MNRTGIEYLDYTWNPVHGCSPVSGGCANCWAKVMARRLAGMGARGYDKKDPFRPTFCPWKLDEPVEVKKPSRIGVVFMGDLFHRKINPLAVGRILNVIGRCERHAFMFLTKRPLWARVLLEAYYQETTSESPYSNLWLGVTAENQKRADERIPILLQIPAAKHFVSIEPMLEYVNLDEYVWKTPHIDKYRLDWIIVGGESGPGARPMNPDWARSVRDQCRDAGVPFFFKKMARKEPIPEDLRIREYPDA